MSRLSYFILLLGVSFNTYSQVIDQNKTITSSKLYTDATLQLEAKQYQDAKTLFTEAIAYYQGNPDYYYGRGVCNYYLDDLKEAQSDIKHAIEMDRNQANFHYYAGAILYKQKDYLRAKYNFEQALVLNDDSDLKIDGLNCKFQIGVCLMKLDYFRAASEAFSNLLLEDPFYDKALLNRGIAYGQLQEFDKACNDFQQASQLGNNRAGDFIEKYCNSGKPVFSKN